MNKIPKVLSIQDFCCIGRCSLTVTIPVLSCCGLQPIALPTSLFGNAPLFEHFTYEDMEKTAYTFLDDWQRNGFCFDAIQSGFLATPTQVGIVTEAIHRFANEDTLVVVDPAMADNGVLYSIFDITMVEAMKQLIGHATIVTPNYTEATLITGRTYQHGPITLENAKLLCKELAQLGPKKVIITSIPTANNILRTALYDTTDQSFTIMDTPHIPSSAPGAGDTFTAIVTANLLQGKSLVEGVRLAVDFIYESVKYTYEQKVDEKEGLLLEHMLPKLYKLQTKS